MNYEGGILLLGIIGTVGTIGTIVFLAGQLKGQLYERLDGFERRLDDFAEHLAGAYRDPRARTRSNDRR